MKFTRRNLIQAVPPFALSACVTNPTGFADIIMMGGDIHTANESASRHAALAIQANKIVAVGTDAEIQQYVGPGTRLVNLAGRSVLPGINDSHLHLLMWAMGQPPFSLDLTFPNVKSIADAVAWVGEQAKSKPKGEWIFGRGWDQPYFSEGRPPTKQDLDAVAPDHPVALTEFSGHAIWANSKALELAGITADTVPPVGGVIVKDGQGQPTGLLFEGAAWVIREVSPEPTVAQNKAALRAGMKELLSRGITSCTVPGTSPDILQQMNEVAAEDNLEKLRITALVRTPDNYEGLLKVLEGFDQIEVANPLWFQMPGVKIMGDGIPTGNKTAWLHQHYVGGGNGSLLIAGQTDEERVAEINRMIEHIHGRNLQIGTHATGDRSIDTVVDAYLRVQAQGGFDDPRHYIIHGDLVSPETLSKMASAKIGANFNPEIKHLIADSQILSIGALRASYEWPYRTAINSGVVVASSSDAPVTYGNWMQGIATMVSRKGKQTGNVSGPEQKITLDEAIRTYTWAGAWQDRAEQYKGTLEAGMMADLLVLDGRIDEIQPDNMHTTKTVMTLVDGHVVYDVLG